MYFETAGKANTSEVIKEAVSAAQKKGIRYIVAASNSGYTADFLKGCGLNAVIVTHVYGFRENGENEMPDDKRKELEDSGMKVVTAAHALSGAERSLSRKFSGVYPLEIIANTLRIFGQGTKVAVEVSTMAMDAGAIPYGEEIVAIGGTGRGADTAVVIRPQYSSNIMDTRICEIICKPR